jgi:hypothetical protein
MAGDATLKLSRWKWSSTHCSLQEKASFTVFKKKRKKNQFCRATVRESSNKWGNRVAIGARGREPLLTTKPIRKGLGIIYLSPIPSNAHQKSRGCTPPSSKGSWRRWEECV